MGFHKYVSLLIALSLGACAAQTEVKPTSEPSNTNTNNTAHESLATPLDKILASRSAEEIARDQYRNPADTLTFFKIEPGMTVAEALPGGGWYSKILAEYLGSDGALYGVNYVDDMWERFGFFSPEDIQNAIESTAKFPSLISEFTDNGISTKGFTFGTVPADLVGTVDRVLFIRALHNLNRFENDAQTMSQALKASSKMLKPDGLVGVVQHRLQEDAPAEGSDGSRGYLKQSDLIKSFENAGFELVAASEINANPKDRPSAKDIVWRLPPTLNGTKDNPELKAKVMAIGESDRMTLLFKKSR